jgi:hypothetical protein
VLVERFPDRLDADKHIGLGVFVVLDVEFEVFPLGEHFDDLFFEFFFSGGDITHLRNLVNNIMHTDLHQITNRLLQVRVNIKRRVLQFTDLLKVPGEKVGVLQRLNQGQERPEAFVVFPQLSADGLRVRHILKHRLLQPVDLTTGLVDLRRQVVHYFVSYRAVHPQILMGKVLSRQEPEPMMRGKFLLSFLDHAEISQRLLVQTLSAIHDNRLVKRVF